MPTALEAEMADREVMGEVFKMAYEGITMDRALLSVVKDDLLRIHLTCKPKPFKLAKSVQNAGGAGTGKPSTATDVGLKRKRLLPRHPKAEKKYKVGFCRGSAQGGMSAVSSTSARSVVHQTMALLRARNEYGVKQWLKIMYLTLLQI